MDYVYISKHDFDNIFKSCPFVEQKFRDFIDAYKKEVNWDALFGKHTIYRGFNYSDSREHNAPKFHEIPFDMQKGLILRFLCETFTGQNGQYVDKEKLSNILNKTVVEMELLFNFGL